MIDLHQLPSEGLRLKGHEDRLALEVGDALRDLDWKLFALPSGKDVFLEVQGKATYEGGCSRCLEPLDRAVEVDSKFLASPEEDLQESGSYTLGSQDLDVVFLGDLERVDELDVVRQQFELAAPMHPLCKESCEGLCPSCGKNWNKGRCSCPPPGQQAGMENNALAKALAGLKLNLSDDPES